MADQGPEEWYRNLPPITRGYMTACFAATVFAQMELVPPTLIYLDMDLVLSKLELWRLLTNFCFFGTFSMPFVFSMFFLIRYGRELEAKRFEARSADMLWFLLLTGVLMVTVSYLLAGFLGPMPFLSQSMLSVIVYLWSREYSEQVISIFGLFNIQAFYFPWVRGGGCSILARVPMLAHSGVTNTPSLTARAAQVLCAIHKLMGGSPVPDLVGIFAGHVYYFLEDVQGMRLKAPAFLADHLDAPRPGAQRAAAANRNAFGGHAWGGGQRLGG